ncbi:MAG TPA: DinB family protein [Thermoanaerobaculia bacterium]
MSTPQFFAERLKAETAAFSKVARALPADRLDYKPHERSTSAGSLAWQIATELDALVKLLETGTIDYKQGRYPSVEEIATATESSLQRLIEATNNVTEERWNGPGKFLWEGNPVWETTVSDMAWGFLFDLIHHRGQLSSYIRPMGGKVPAIYGPSADSES